MGTPSRSPGSPAAPRRFAAGTPRGQAANGLDEQASVRVGAAEDTPQATLESLASDPSVTVRAAVAMNARAPQHVNDQLARDGDERVRALLARKLANLVPGLSGPARGDLQRRAYETLALLVEDEAVRVRATIAEVVKEMPGLPRDLALRLARDTALPVSDPIIRLSPLLTPEDLLALITVPPSPATTVSVASRPHLNEEVADAIAHSNHVGAITALLQNKSAAIREATLDALIARAGTHTEWHEPLVTRPALPARAARALAEFVASDLLRVLVERNDLDPGLTRALSLRLEQARAARNAFPIATSDMTSAQAMEAARALAEADRLTEETIRGAAQRGEARFVAALLAVAAEVPITVVDRASALRSAKGLVSLVWKAGFSMRVAPALQALLARLPPPSIMPAGPGGSFPLAVEEMRWQVDFLARPGG